MVGSMHDRAHGSVSILACTALAMFCIIACVPRGGPRSLQFVVRSAKGEGGGGGSESLSKGLSSQEASGGRRRMRRDERSWGFLEDDGARTTTELWLRKGARDDAGWLGW